MQARKFIAEAVGTFLLVFFAVGVATLSFGFKFAGSSVSAGVVTTAFAFGLVLLALAYTLGPISGCHVNPAVTLGFFASGRMALTEAIGFWIAQFVGGILGALVAVGRHVGFALLFAQQDRPRRGRIRVPLHGQDQHRRCLRYWRSYSPCCSCS